jgi:hypothetical protein
MTETQAHTAAQKRSRKHPAATFYVIREEQNDGSMYDVGTDADLNDFYNGLSDGSIMAAYEGGQRCED